MTHRALHFQTTNQLDVHNVLLARHYREAHASVPVFVHSYGTVISFQHLTAQAWGERQPMLSASYIPACSHDVQTKDSRLTAVQYSTSNATSRFTNNQPPYLYTPTLYAYPIHTHSAVWASGGRLVPNCVPPSQCLMAAASAPDTMNRRGVVSHGHIDDARMECLIHNVSWDDHERVSDH